MFKQIEYISEAGVVRVGQSYPYFLSKVEGLGFNNELNLTKGMYQDGVYYTGSSLKEREVTLQIVGINKDTSVLKEHIYRVFSPKLEGQFIYKKGNIERTANARVRSVNIADRSHNEVLILVDIVCPDFFLYNLFDTVVPIATWEKRFYFPVPYGLETVIFGMYNAENIRNLKNNGHVDTNYIIKLTVNSTVNNPKITNVFTREYIELNTSLVLGDIVVIDFKSKKITKNGISIFNTRKRGSTFFPCRLGDNYLQFDSENGIENLEIEVKYSNAYVGV